VEQYSNNSQNEFLWTLLANPANDAHLYAYNLQRLVNDFPQSGILQALLAHASDEKNLKQAAAYFNPKSLFKLINAPSTFVGVPAERIVIQSCIASNGHIQHIEQPHPQESPAVQQEETIVRETGEQPSYDSRALIDTDPGTSERFLEPAPIADQPEAAALSEPTAEPQHLIEPVAEVPESAKEQVPVVTPETINPETTVVTAEQADHQVVAEINEEVSAGIYNPAENIIADHETPSGVHHIEDVLVEKNDERIESVIPESEIPHFVQPVEDEGNDKSGRPGVAEYQTPAVPPISEEVQVPKDEPLETVAHGAHFAEPPAETEEAGAYEQGHPVAVIEDTEQFEPTDFAAEDYIKENTDLEPEIPLNDDLEETFDEIVGIENIHFSDQSTYKPATGDKFFTFDREFGAHTNEEKEEAEQSGSTVSTGLNGHAEAEQKDVSKYHDEKLPYSFLWWLDKTRKQHSAVYQPYVKPPANIEPNKKPKKLTDELQQQYFENIFHITSVEELDKTTPPPKAPYDIKRKEHVIIERFIKEEPQIRPQSSDKLDNENKAKKSSEDRDELVTETLAAIYSDQMLYHKAIASYKKLMLKFPEKSRYFAEKIEQLEKKTN